MIRVGCGVWRNKDWEGSLYGRGSDPATYLFQYSRVFTAVECHSTFYALPKAETIQKWKSSVSGDFRFCFKAPKTITHIKRLQSADRDLASFLNRIEPLGEHLGPIMLQFPPSFSPKEIGTLTAFLRILPKEFIYTIEFRHPGYYTPSTPLQPILYNHVSLCVVDARIKFPSAQPKEKHTSSLTPVNLGQSPIIRFIGSEDADRNQNLLEQWVPHFSHWQNENKTPYFFAHTETNRIAPRIAAHFLSFFPGSPQLKFYSDRQLELF